MAALEAFPELELSKVAFSRCSPPSLPSQNKSQADGQRGSWLRAEMLQHLQRQSRGNPVSARVCAMPPALCHHPGPGIPPPPPPPKPPKPRARGTDPSAGGTRSPDALIACVNDTLGQSNATQGSAGPASPGTRRPDPAPGSGKCLYSCVLYGGITTVFLWY